MKLGRTREITTASSSTASKVHAYLAGNKRTVCSSSVWETSNAEFVIGHEDNCKTCNRQVTRWSEEGRLS